MEGSFSHFSEIKMVILEGNLLILITTHGSNNLCFWQSMAPGGAQILLLDIFIDGCFYRTFPGDHFPEESFDLFSQAVFIKVCKEDFFVGEDRF